MHYYLFFKILKEENVENFPRKCYICAMNYENTLKQFFKYPDTFKQILDEKLNSPSTLHFNLKIKDSQTFFYYSYPLYEKVFSVFQKSVKLNKIYNSLPGIAKNQYIRNTLVVEVKKTNEIEGVFSSRKEIFELTEDLKKNNKSNKISSIVNKYLMLLDGEGEKDIRSCADIRKIYDGMFFSDGESLIENDNKPDGLYFRKNTVGVYDLSNNVIHSGLDGEDKIISAMDEALEILNNKEINIFIRIAIFHFFFEYIHPFYDGNGRIGRYIISQKLYDEINDVFAFRVSAAINAKKNNYYKAFESTEDIRNSGDITTFAYELLDIFESEYDDSIIYAQNKQEQLNLLKKQLIDETHEKYSKHQEQVLWILIQARVFSDFGVTAKAIASTIGVSVKTTRTLLNFFKGKGMLVENKYSKTLYYNLFIENGKED